MHSSKTKNLVHPRVVVLNLLLVLSLLFAQWLGISHSIFHASQNSVVSIANVEPVGGDTFDHQKSSSFCSLFDAAALGVAVHATPCTAPAVFTPTLHEQSSFQLGWIQPFSVYFSSRAPPQLA
jgi:hypothetical protein